MNLQESICRTICSRIRSFRKGTYFGSLFRWMKGTLLTMAWIMRVGK